MPAADADAPASTYIEQNADCARVSYSPTVQQQNSISAKGLDVDFIIQYDVDLADPMGDIQVSTFDCAWLSQHDNQFYGSKTNVVHSPILIGV